MKSPIILFIGMVGKPSEIKIKKFMKGIVTMHSGTALQNQAVRSLGLVK